MIFKVWTLTKSGHFKTTYLILWVYFICILPSVTDLKFYKKIRQIWKVRKFKSDVINVLTLLWMATLTHAINSICVEIWLSVLDMYVLIFWNMQLHVNSFPVLHPLSKANYLMHNIRLTMMAYVCWRQFHGGIILIISDQCNIWDNQAMSQFDYDMLTVAQFFFKILV